MKDSDKLLAGCVLIVIFLNIYLTSATLQTSDQEHLSFKKLGQIDTGGIVKRVDVIGNIAYVADFSLGFKTYDISNPGNPLELDTLDHPNYYDPDARGGHSLAIRNDIAILDFTHGGIKLVNISDPADLREIGTYYSGGEYYGLVVDGDFVYTVKHHVDASEELLIIDIYDISSPSEAGRYSNDHKIVISHVYENIAYVYTEERNKLHCLDTTDPANIEEIGQIEWYPSDVEIIGNRAYVGTENQGLSIYDMSNPLDPLLLGQYDSDFVCDVDIAGDLVFVALGDRGLKIFNASGTDLVVEIGHINDGDKIMSVCAQNGVVYVFNSLTGIIEIVQIQGLDIQGLDGGITLQTSGFGLHLFIFLTIPCLLIIKRKRKKCVLEL